ATGSLGRPGRVFATVRATDGKVGGAASFQAEPSGQIVLPLDLSTLKSGVFTISFWLRPQDRAAPYGTCVDAGGAKGFVIRVTSNDRLAFGAGGVWNAAATPETLLPGAWVHVAFSYDGARFRLYLSGAEVGSHAPEIPPVFPAALQLGSVVERLQLPDGTKDDAMMKPLPGDLDELAVFDRVLTPAELAALAKSAR
ncbi:MAG: LamG domain-containing protein, partial [Burkholderiales bacterium]|nr:LamG domain-containing protein [Opitutaceae bacterium]